MKKLSAAARKQNEDLIKITKELESFAYIASHDLQEPLRIVRSFANLIVQKESENLSETGKDYLMRIQDAVKRMQGLIDDLLAYSRTNTTEKKFERTDLNNIMEQVKAALRIPITEKNAIIETANLPELNVIVFQFRQLLQNLLSNSLKFAKKDEPPHIIVKSEIVQGNLLQNVKLPHDQQYCHISVQDNGIGFEQRFSERVFEIFQRLHGREQYAGTGIGLAIVKKNVENHNGIITATSELGKGALFDIYIPVS